MPTTRRSTQPRPAGVPDDIPSCRPYVPAEARDPMDILYSVAAIPSEYWGVCLFRGILSDGSGAESGHAIEEIIATVEGVLVTAHCSEVLVPTKAFGFSTSPDACAVRNQIRLQTEEIVTQWLPGHAHCAVRPRHHELRADVKTMLHDEIGMAAGALASGAHVRGHLKILMADGRLQSFDAPTLPPAGATAEAQRLRAPRIHAMHANIRREARQMGSEPIAALLVEVGASSAPDGSEDSEALVITMATRDCVLFGGTDIMRISGKRGVGPGFVDWIDLVPMRTPSLFYEGLLAKSVQATV